MPWKLCVGLLLLLAVVSVPASAATRPGLEVSIKDFAYTPKALTVKAGATVTWINHDEETHTVTSKTGAFGSTGLSDGERFSQRFAKPGTYVYFCALHPKMTATIVVQ